MANVDHIEFPAARVGVAAPGVLPARVEVRPAELPRRGGLRPGSAVRPTAARCGMTIIHPVAVILDILAEAGVPHDRLHDAQRRIAAAYREVNEVRPDARETPCPARS